MYAKKIGVHEQLAFMKLHWPTFNSRVSRGMMIAQGDLCPAALCATYRVRIAYRGGDPPEVHVLQPSLRPRVAGELIPHMYGQERLCLYLPDTQQWEPDKLIATTIVPWTSLWLYFYEVWHATSEWLGGGIEPGKTRPIRNRPEHEPFEKEQS
jgi:hypothetical protein